MRRVPALRRLRAAVLALILALPGQGRTDPLVLDAENTLKLTVLLLGQGQSEKALSYATILAEDQPQNARILTVKATAERNLGRYDAAQASARLAWRHAQDDGQAWDAAMAMAQALASDGQKWRSQFWLRRAMQVAPDDGARRIAERDFGYVRNRSRLWLQFDADLRPSSNVNNGSSADYIWVHGVFPFPVQAQISGESRALSGMEGSLGINARYRLRESADARTDLRIGALQTMVWLSDSAQDQAPDMRGSDYAYASVNLGLEQVWKVSPSLELSAAGSLGQTWYGGDALADVSRLSFGARKAVAAGLVLDASLALERQDRVDAPVSSSDNVTLSLGGNRVMAASGDRLSLGLTLRDSRSESGRVAHEMARLRLDWTKRDPVLGARFSAGIWGEWRDYARADYTPGGRQDQIFGTELSMTFDTIDYMGFVPVMTLSASRNGSNVALYESENLGLGLSVRSKF